MKLFKKKYVDNTFAKVFTIDGFSIVVTKRIEDEKVGQTNMQMYYLRMETRLPRTRQIYRTITYDTLEELNLSFKNFKRKHAKEFKDFVVNNA